MNTAKKLTRGLSEGGRSFQADLGGKLVALTNLEKLFWPELGITKRRLLEYYIEVSPFLLPHLAGRAMVMKRYPNGIGGDYFFMKRTPAGSPDWLQTCSIEHASGNIIAFPVINDLASLLYVVNLGCIDLNPWYARCDDVDRPDFLHFDLDPVPPAGFEKVREAALVLRYALEALSMKPHAKTSGSKGIHVYVAIKRGPLQKEVWTVAKKIAQALAQQHPRLLTSEYRISQRPPGRILVDYNQNAWGRTLASVYSARPKNKATVSAPVSWQELEGGAKLEDFTLFTMAGRLAKVKDLWKPLLSQRGRFNLERLR